jgi:serine/threonine protein kinase
MQPAPKASGSPVSSEEFLQNLADSGLFSRDEIDHILPTMQGDLALNLIAAGKLTHYQADLVRQRKFAELRIGNYEVLQRLGAGGMGTVFKARHRRMKRIVALKVLSPAANQSDTFVHRFQREVEVISRLSHPNIVMAFDADEAEAGHFLVMEFVGGRDLASEVQERGPLPLREAIASTLQSARALDYAHKEGIIHRDIKPANLLRDVSGVVKVADLGLARFNDTLKSTAVSSLTQAGGVVGTVDYMPPEQAFDSTTIDHRADIYSLGCTLFFLLSGRPPYLGDSLMAILLKHREAPIPSLTAFRSDVPPAVDALFARMVAKKADDRYRTMAEVVQALEGLDTLTASTPGQPGVSGPRKPPTGTMPPPASPRTDATVDLRPGSTSCLLEKQPTAHPAPAPIALPVLLVEPSRTQASIIRKFLLDLGTTHILVAHSGKNALEMIRTTPVRAVILAMHLADMTGVQLIQQARNDPQFRDVGFILVSSETDAAEAAALREMPHTVLLPKPFDLQRLAAALGQIAAG